MSSPSDLGDFTLKQLLHLYQTSETGQPNQVEKASKSDLVSAKDIDLFSRIVANKEDRNKVNTSQKNSNLTEILDNLIEDIDSK